MAAIDIHNLNPNLGLCSKIDSLWTSDVIYDLYVLNPSIHPEHGYYTYHIENIEISDIWSKSEDLLNKLAIEWECAYRKGNEHVQLLINDSYINVKNRILSRSKLWMVVLRVEKINKGQFSVSLWDGRHRLYILKRLCPMIKEIPVVIIHQRHIRKSAKEIFLQMRKINSGTVDYWRYTLGV